MSERNWELYFALMETLGAEVLAMEFAKKMSREQMNDFLETTAREHDLQSYNDEMLVNCETCGERLYTEDVHCEDCLEQLADKND